MYPMKEHTEYKLYKDLNSIEKDKKIKLWFGKNDFLLVCLMHLWANQELVRMHFQFLNAYEMMV